MAPQLDAKATRDLIDTIQKCVTIAAVIIGGIWTYNAFIEHREVYPKANLTHGITDFKLPNGDNFIRVNISIRNSGNVLLSLSKAEIRLEHVLPINQRILDELVSRKNKIMEGRDRFQWSPIRIRQTTWNPGTAEIEPGESHNMYYEFIIPPEHKVINVYTWFENIEKRPVKSIGWYASTLHVLG